MLAVTPESDESRASFVDNLAASIYKQGELANEAEDYRAAADHFLRIRTAAPTSSIRATAEYDAGAALIRLQDWKAAVEVLEAFRSYLPGEQTAARGHQTDRLRLPAERPVVARRRRIRPHRIPVRRSGITQRGAARRGRPLRAIQFPRSRLGCVHPLRQRVSQAGRDGHRDPIQDRRDVQGGARRDALSPELEEIVQRRRRRRIGKDRPDADACGTFGTGPRRAALWGFRCREAAATLRDQPAGQDSSAWMPRSRPWAGWWITESTT